MSVFFSSAAIDADAMVLPVHPAPAGSDKVQNLNLKLWKTRKRKHKD
jgi:3-deoxy-D-arabino-heptulosonate 7-phosphate (DAHP) synthase